MATDPRKFSAAYCSTISYCSCIYLSVLSWLPWSQARTKVYDLHSWLTSWNTCCCIIKPVLICYSIWVFCLVKPVTSCFVNTLPVFLTSSTRWWTLQQLYLDWSVSHCFFCARCAGSNFHVFLVELSEVCCSIGGFKYYQGSDHIPLIDNSMSSNEDVISHIKSSNFWKELAGRFPITAKVDLEHSVWMFYFSETVV